MKRILLVTAVVIGVQFIPGAAEAQAGLPPEVGSSWEQVPIDETGDNPFPVDSFSLCSTKRDAGFLFGGGEDFLSFPSQFPFADFTNDLYSWRVLEDPVRIRFELISSGAGPSERGFPEIACTENKVFIFGGVNEFFTTVADSFWEYDLGTGEWTFRGNLSPAPVPINGVTMQAKKGEIFLYGGIVSMPFLGIFEPSDQLWRYTIQDQVWDFIPLPGALDDPKPKHVARSGIVEVSDTKVLVFGGERFEPTPSNPFNFPIDTEVHLLDVKSGAFSRLADGPGQNYGAFACNENRCLLFGGDIPGGCGENPQNVTDATWLFELATGTWQELLSIANTPMPAKRSRGAWIDGFFYKFGGFDAICVDPDSGTIERIPETGVFRLRLDS